jgi:hypothetical protein
MHDSQLIHLLQSLSQREINILRHFINTNCPNKKIIFQQTNTSVSTNKISILYDILRKEYPEFSGECLQKESVFSKVYPGENYSDKKMRNIQYELSKVIEFYLIHNDIICDHAQFKMHFVNQLEKRNLGKLYSIKMNAIDDEFDKQDNRDEDYYLQKYILANKKRVYNENRMAVGKNELTYRFLNEEIEHFTNHFLPVIFKQLSLAKYFRDYLNIETDTGLYDHIVGYFRDHSELLSSNESLLIWNKFLLLDQSNAGKNDIIELKCLLDKNRNSFKELDYQYLYTDLLNFCTKKYSADETKYKEILLGLLKDCIDKEVYLRSGYIHEQNYTAVVFIALSLGELELAEGFILKYKDALLPEFREDIYSYNYALYYFKLKNYDKALEMLRTAKSGDFYFKLGVNDLLLKIFYEMNSIEPALLLVDSYKHFISRNEMMPPEYKTSHGKFLKYYKEIIKIKSGSDETSADYLAEKLKSEKDVSSKAWLTEKLRELEKELV